MLVRHNGREVKFDWSGEHNTVQWAAFYSDCEHEVLPVTSGYRVTLTYNLYFNASKFQIYTSRNWGRSSLPLFGEFSSALRNKHFMSSGILPLGVNLSNHAQAVLSGSIVTIIMPILAMEHTTASQEE